MKMKATILAVAAAALFVLGMGSAKAEHFQVTRKIVQLWSGPDDDMRPEISGTVTAVGVTGVNLEGGAIVPVTGAAVQVGDLATFICEEISQGRNPEMRDCELLRTQPPEKPNASGQVELW